MGKLLAVSQERQARTRMKIMKDIYLSKINKVGMVFGMKKNRLNTAVYSKK